VSFMRAWNHRHGTVAHADRVGNARTGNARAAGRTHHGMQA